MEHNWQVTHREGMGDGNTPLPNFWQGTVRGTPYASDSHLSSASAPDDPTPATVRGTPYASNDRPSPASASDSRLPSAPATSSLFRNAFGRMTSYATRSRSHDAA